MREDLEPTQEIYSWRLSIWGSALFIAYGLGMVILALPFSGGVAPGWQTVVAILFGLGLLLPYAGLALGWIRSFPRWSFPYLGLALFLSSYLQNISSRGLMIGGVELSSEGAWGWRAWVPLALAALAALIITRFSPLPLRRLLRRAWDDWTLLSFAMFGCLPILALFSFVEAGSQYALVFLPLLALILSAASVLYLRLSQRWQRVLALLLGTVTSLSIISLVPTIAYRGEGWVDIPSLILAVLVVTVLFFSPVLIEGYKRLRLRLAQTLWKA